MTSVPSAHRAAFTHFLAYSLICGGIFTACWPWLRSAATDEAEVPASGPHVLAAANLEPPVSLPTENLNGRQALECNLELIRAGLEQLKRTADYTGTFHKQERVDGILDDGSVIKVKCRHQPLSLYLNWIKGDRGRELIFVEGENDGEMLVRLGGIRGRMLPVFKIDPNGEAAREKTRHHISQVSILNLTKRVVDHCEQDLGRVSGLKCRLIVDDVNRDNVIRTIVEYQSPGIAGEYRKTIHDLDRQTLLPVVIKTYGWPEAGDEIPAEQLDEETLLEFYEYSELRFDQNLTGEDFSPTNPAYCFQKRR